VPAYAATIHKSQGSEYPAVAIPILTQHHAMLQRNLLYTGVTRGKRLVVLVGQKKAVAIAVRNVSGRRRWSKLNEWLAATAMIDRRKSETASSWWSRIPTFTQPHACISSGMSTRRSRKRAAWSGIRRAATMSLPTPGCRSLSQLRCCSVGGRYDGRTGHGGVGDAPTRSHLSDPPRSTEIPRSRDSANSSAKSRWMTIDASYHNWFPLWRRG
jgi:UvrD-like helicase C-terminal domain